jgi:hypothetical protein
MVMADFSVQKLSVFNTKGYKQNTQARSCDGNGEERIVL